MASAHVPTDESRKLVAELTAFGLRQDEICSILGLGSTNTLKKHYAQELSTGLAEANAKVARSLFRSALDGNTTAQIFWLKTRARWVETQRIEHTGEDGEAIRMGVDASEAAAMQAAILKRAGLANLHQAQATPTNGNGGGNGHRS